MSNSSVKLNSQTGNTPQQPARQPQLGEVTQFQDQKTGQMVPFMLQNLPDPATGQITLQWVPVSAQQAHAPNNPQNAPLGGQQMPKSSLQRGETPNPTLRGLGHKDSSSFMADRTKFVLESDAEKLIDWKALDESSKKMYISKKDPQSTWYLCVLSCAGYCPASKIVKEGWNGMVMKKGIYQRTVQPGLRTYNPCTEDIQLVYMG
jgi:hypothetical protein